MIVAVIPTLFHPPSLTALLAILKKDNIAVILVDTKGRPPDIYRWWNEGVAQAREMGATEIAVLNDDIVIAPGSISAMAKALRSDPAVALVSPENGEWVRRPIGVAPDVTLRYSVGHGGPYTTPAFLGWNFMLKAELDLPRFDEKYRWYWGDQAFEEAVRKAGYKVAVTLGVVSDTLWGYSSQRVGDKILGPLKAKDIVRWGKAHLKHHGSDKAISKSMPHTLWRHNLLLPDQETPDDAKRYWGRFADLHPDWEMRVIDAPLDAADYPETAWLWSWTVHVVQLADLVRFEVLWREGGVFVDWDVEPYKPLDPLTTLEGFAGYEHNGDGKAEGAIIGNSVMGFRPRHPAAARILDRVLERCVNDHDDMMATGPRAVSHILPGRTDVVLFPPGTFHPLSYGSKAHATAQDGEFANVPWAYAVHRLHGSWVPVRFKAQTEYNRQTDLYGEAHPVILVPRREDGGERDRLWEFCRDWWAQTFPDIPIYEGTHEGPGLFNRSLAINRAATEAGDWDVAIIIDSDSIGEEGVIRQALDKARKENCMVLPFMTRFYLTAAETKDVLAGEKLIRNGEKRNIRSGIVVVPRPLWNAVEGFDEGYVGWGAEDEDFADACDAIRPSARLNGAQWHLWHEPAFDSRNGSPSLVANRKRWLAKRSGTREVAQIVVPKSRYHAKEVKL